MKVNASVSEKAKQRVEIEKQIEDFLDQGGEITEVPVPSYEEILDAIRNRYQNAWGRDQLTNYDKNSNSS
ncbi:hypothetical protein H0A36_24835 [Endozoicomonas sp. SM1973]|uniref:Transcriptional regulator SutA RNAP-binding domain-containing protein n=1 Tax=Spartinivicinus marinus TaxID=2994442 RepID=A0A853I8S3_9GAMM|nr:hypothetical protein [Spartinivicinus marinus]MCX4027708.1 hypothetical protein [Spartinivicinus marinus]NYZ69249.1 hypothetical protein [Spartinivicinus marinus]